MNIITLNINNTRGIKSLEIFPDGKSFVIWGPNGSGKSAVVDAIDFLLTGRITRLEGSGTGGITLNQHGPHIDCQPESASVSADIIIPGHSDPISISRFMDNPGTLIYPEELENLLDPILNLAKKGQHVLSRRDILKFITSSPSSRAEGIQILLNITDIDSIRGNLVWVRGKTDRDIGVAKTTLASAQALITTTIQAEAYDADLIRDFVNSKREILGADPIDSVTANLLKEGITLHLPSQDDESVNIVVIESDVNNLLSLAADDRKKDLYTKNEALVSTIKDIKADPELLVAVDKLSLYELGASLIDEDGDCPLCEAEWSPGELKDKLDKKIQLASKASEYKNSINLISTNISSASVSVEASIETIVTALIDLDLIEKYSEFNYWKDNLEGLIKDLEDPLSAESAYGYDSDDIQVLLAPEGIFDNLPEILKMFKDNIPEVSVEQTAWDLLTRLEENLKMHERAQMDLAESINIYQLASALHDTFMESRDEILSSLYDNIKDRFVELYKFIHESDEDDFSASLQPTNAGLTMEVDFYGRGIHPPHALHSEGHQDSMGLCLYLALYEKLVGNIFRIAILDDVIMSVDSNHRRNVCELLSEFFPDTQFFITTHDKTWAHQLRSSGIVASKNSIEFYKWTIDSGPYTHLETDLWRKIDSYLEENDVLNAAVLLRKGSEQFLAIVCDSIEAHVKFRLDLRNNLGDYLPSALTRYKSILNKAKQSARSWSKNEDYEALVEIESSINQIHQRTQAEQWNVNASIHFNQWENLTPDDFRPVREAFQDFHSIFVCQDQDCGSIVRITKEGYTDSILRCNCGNIAWNLVPK